MNAQGRELRVHAPEHKCHRMSFIIKIFTEKLFVIKYSIRGILLKALKHLLIAQPPFP